MTSSRRDVLAQAGGLALTTLAAGAASGAKAASAPIKIVDTQVHLWRDATPSPIHRQVRTFWVDDLTAEMQTAGVDAVVLCPPRFFAAGNTLYRDIVAQHPDKFACWGYFDINDPKGPELMKTWRQPPEMIGLRFTFNGDDGKYWTNGDMDWMWPSAQAAHMPLAFESHTRLGIIRERAEQYPHLKIIVDHMAADTSKKGPEAFAEVKQLVKMAKYPNIAVKVSGSPAGSALPYPFRDAQDAAYRCFDAFGPERTMWGTDLTRQPCSYKQCVTMFTEEMPWLKGNDLRMVMGESFMRWMEWRPKGWTA